MSTPVAQAELALKQAEALLELAKTNEWEKLEALQKEHGALVNLIALAEIPAEEQSKVRDLLIQVRELNRQTIKLADANKNELVKEKQKLSKGAKMQKALDSLG